MFVALSVWLGIDSLLGFEVIEVNSVKRLLFGDELLLYIQS